MILILCASVGANKDLSETLLQIAQSLGGECVLVNLVDLELPLYSAPEEAKGIPEGATQLAAQVVAADGFVVVAPEYNGSTPPSLTNAIAWVSRAAGDDWRSAFNEKVAALATHSGGAGGKVLAAMRQQLSHLGTTVLGRELAISGGKSLNQSSAEAVLSQLLSLSGK